MGRETKTCCWVLVTHKDDTITTPSSLCAPVNQSRKGRREHRLKDERKSSQHMMMQSMDDEIHTRKCFALSLAYLLFYEIYICLYWLTVFVRSSSLSIGREREIGDRRQEGV